MDYLHRQALFRSKIEKLGLDAFLITSDYNWFYLTGFYGDEGLLLITRDNCYLFVDFRYVEEAELESVGCEIVQVKQGEAYEAINKVLSGGMKVGFEDGVRYAEYKRFAESLSSVELLPFGGIVEEMRKVKDEDEMVLIKEACKITDEAFTYISRWVKPGVTEMDVASELEYFCRKKGVEGMSFPSIVLGGARASLPHGKPSNKILNEGELLLLDFGVRLNGYCSDMTRMVAIGEIDSETNRIYSVLKDAQQRAIDEAKAGMESGELDRLVREWLGEYAEYFGHGLGHGVGIQVHEYPYVSQRRSELLVPGMVFTIEPGIYMPGRLGMRIEDMIVVKEKGVELLYTSTKDI
ncbi:MAG: aminopeptidase P family protein [Synergistetes bacterium]|nr:aminopeptidase P family protein [Synergistota bacterium]